MHLRLCYYPSTEWLRKQQTPCIAFVPPNTHKLFLESKSRYSERSVIKRRSKNITWRSLGTYLASTAARVAPTVHIIIYASTLFRAFCILIRLSHLLTEIENLWEIDLYQERIQSTCDWISFTHNIELVLNKSRNNQYIICMWNHTNNLPYNQEYYRSSKSVIQRRLTL